jgi:hypothetical protein
MSAATQLFPYMPSRCVWGQIYLFFFVTFYVGWCWAINTVLRSHPILFCCVKLVGKDRGWLTEVQVVVNFMKLFRREGKKVSEVSIYKIIGY